MLLLTALNAIVCFSGILNGVMALILHYFTEFVYDVVVKQLTSVSKSTFDNL